MTPSTPQQNIYQTSLALLTDLYQITMAYGYWKAGMADYEAAFQLLFRTAPFKGGYAIGAGLATVIDYLTALQFTDDDLTYLETLRGNDDKALLEPAFLDYLKNMRLTIDLDAVEEGTVVFPQEPLLCIKGPLLQCQLLETPLLTAINYQTLIATKAARICETAQGEPVLEFGLRRAHGFDGGLAASRAAYLGGCTATSNVLAGKLYNIPVRGTHGHSWVMAFETEFESFKTYANALPNNSIFLVDTYNTLEGVKDAVILGKWLQEHGHHFMGIRLDSGDLAYLSIQSRKILDDAGFKDAIIIASNDLDEHIIASLKSQGATISVWGVGTRLTTAHGQCALDGVYKLGAIRKPGEAWQYKIKLSEQIIKISTPGISRVRRFYRNNYAYADVIYDEAMGMPDHCVAVDPLDITKQHPIPKDTTHKDLLVPIFRQGQLVYQSPTLAESRQKTLDELAQFHKGIKRILNPHIYPVGVEQHLQDFKTQLIFEMREAYNSPKK